MDTGGSERDPLRASEQSAPKKADPAALRTEARQLLAEFNATTDTALRRRASLLDKLLGSANDVVIRPPFQVDCGVNIYFDEACFVNSGCTIHDTAEVRIGSFTQLSPGVQILTAQPGAADRGRPVTIGRNVWVGANAVIQPGVTIGDDAIISAGAVVTQDVPDGATVTGNPARPIG